MRERLGPYEIVAPLGAGGMGEVYRALDRRLNRTVAIKVIAASALQHSEARTRFEREALAIASLDHPHICALHDIGHDEGVDFLVMQYLEGETLASRLLRGPLPLDEALRHAIDIADAIDAAHRHGVTHRDLKPSNIMLTKTGAVLLDFGLAKLRASPALHELSERPTASNLTRDGAIVGTVRYMAPEVLDGKEADTRSDLFSFGALVYEMVTGRCAFAGDSEARVIAAILSDQPPPMTTLRPDTPAGLESAVRTCLAKDPDDRWQDARDLVRQLRWIAGGPGTPTPAQTLSRAPKAWSGFRHRRVILAAGTLAVMMAVGIPLWWQGRPEVVPPPPPPPPPPHLAALPCDAPSDPSAARAFCDGLTEVLIGKLARLTASHALQVTPQIGGPRRDVLTISDARYVLGATRVLQVGVQPDMRGFRLDYALIDPRLPSPIDAQTFTIDASGIFDGQDRIVAWLVRVMALDLTHPERAALVAHPTSNAEAQMAYLTARGQMATRRGPAAIDAALASFGTAAAHDATFAEARAGLGLAWWAKHLQSPDPQARIRASEASNRASESCAEAVRAQPALVEGHTCLGTILYGLRDYRGAAEALQRAVDVDPAYDDAQSLLGRAHEELHAFGDAEKVYLRAVEGRPHYSGTHVWLGNFYNRQGRYEDAAQEYARAVALVPDNARGRAVLAVPWMYLGRYEQAIAGLQESVAMKPTREAYVNWGMTLFRMRRFDEAAVLIERARALGAPDYVILGTLARAYYWSGKNDSRAKAESLYAEAIPLAQQQLEKALPTADLHITLADYYAKTGRGAEARSHLQQAGLSLSDKDRPTDPHLFVFAALVYSQLGERETAIAWLERAVFWGVSAAELRAWIELDSVRDSPAFQTLVRSK
ncbi:MAG: protein kinase [Acidobacteria bacterium]|nr:protein kinase [Acidobacteriota bacterium]